MNFPIVSYAAAGFAYLGLAVLLLTGWRGRTLATRLVVATVATACWAGMDAFALRDSNVSFKTIFIAEMLRDAAWLTLLIAMARSFLPRIFAVGIHALWLSIFAAGLALPWLERVGFAISETAFLSRSGLTLAFVALVLLEQIYRNATGRSQNSLRYFVLGVGTLFAYDLFLYAQAELLKGISADTWATRGIVCALGAPIMAVAVRRNPDWSLDIFVSRQVVFYSTAFLAAGAYLLLMATGGYYVRAMGGTWGGIAQILFFVGAGLVLAVLLFSSAMRRRLMVFISKHFFRNKYDYRVEWLRFIRTLSSRNDTDIRCTSLRAVAQILASPGGILFLQEEPGREYVPVATWSQHGDQQAEKDFAVTAVDAGHELASFLRDRQWVVDRVEYADAPDRYQNIALPEWLSASATLRIVSPVLELDRLVGFIVLQAPPAPFELTYEDRDLLKTVGRHVATYLAQQDANRKLAESRQFEAYSRLTAFMMHDLKNAAAQLTLIVANAARHKHNPEFVDDAIGTIGNAADRIARLIEQLQRGTSVQAGRRTDICAIVRRAVARSAGRLPTPSAALPSERINVTADPERLTLVLEHVIRNAQDATPADGAVTVSLACTADWAEIVVVDTGQGMPPEFIRDRLFRPFDSTKGSKGMGIGAYQAREYARSLGGDVAVVSESGVGTRFSIQLPLLSREPAIEGMDYDSETQAQTMTRSTRQSKLLTIDTVATPATKDTARP